MKKGRGFKTVIFLGRYGVVVFGRLVWDQGSLQESSEPSMALQKSSLTLSKLVSQSHFCQRLTLEAVISEGGKTSVTRLNSAHLQIIDLSPSKKNIFQQVCIFPNNPTRKFPLSCWTYWACIAWTLPAWAAEWLELSRKVLPSIQQHLHLMMLAVSGCPVGTPRNYM